MTIYFINRITGRQESTLPSEPILGEWQVISESCSFVLNTVNLNSRRYIVPNANQQCFLHSEDGSFRSERSFNTWQMPTDIISESVCYFATCLKDTLSWSDWITISPLVPGIDKKIEIQLLDKAINQRLKHLQEVSNRPRTYLKVEIERLPVSRAKHIPPSAIQFLASHTEDWERRTMRSVLPKRILSRVQEDLYNIYENRIAKQLIDNLLNYLNLRIQELNKLKKLYENAADFSQQTQKSQWRNAQRICTLWGEQFEADTRVKQAELSLQKLTKLQYSLKGALDSVLYESLPKRVYVGTSLKMTNILVNDQHYRHIGLLWKEWSQWGGGHKKKSEQLFQENQQLCQGFEAFCLLLIGRALVGFNLQQIGDIIPTPGSEPIQFQGSIGKISLQWNEDGSFWLDTEGVPKKLHFIPLIAALNAAPNSKAAESIIQKLTDSLTPIHRKLNQHRTKKETPSTIQHHPYKIILYLGMEEERKKISPDLQRRMNTLGNDFLSGELAAALLPVSPLEIESVERVARAIQWWLNSQRYKAYPPRVELQQQIDRSLLENATWLRLGEKAQKIQLIRLPSPEEEEIFISCLNSRIAATRGRGRAAQDELNLLEKLEKLPAVARDRLQPILTCPTCHSTKVDLHPPKDSQSFSCKCLECGSCWGTKSCGACRTQYPFIQLGSIESEQPVRQPGWIDRIFGRDVLAVPCWKSNNEGAFICSECGSCSNAQRFCDGGCQRCSAS